MFRTEGWRERRQVTSTWTFELPVNLSQYSPCHHQPEPKCAVSEDKARQLTVGQEVMARNSRDGDKWLPGVVVERKGALSYVVQMKSGVATELSNSANHSDDLAEPGFEPETNSDPVPETEPDGAPPEEPPETEAAVRRYPSRIRNPPTMYGYGEL